MGSTIRQLQEQVRELEKTNRMQAVEIWQLKEEKRDFEKKVELLLNMGSGVSIAEEERPATRKISFGQVFYSDGSVQREVGAEIENGEAFEDVEEVDAVTIQGLENTGSDVGLWNHGQLCISDENQQTEVSFPPEEDFWEDSSKEVSWEDSTKEAILKDPSEEALLEDSTEEVNTEVLEDSKVEFVEDIIGGEVEKASLKNRSSLEDAVKEVEGAVHEESGGPTDCANQTSRTAVKGIQRIVRDADVDAKGAEGMMLGRREKHLKRSEKVKGDGKGASVEELRCANLVQVHKLRPRTKKSVGREDSVSAEYGRDAQRKKSPSAKGRDSRSDSREGKTGKRREVENKELVLKEETLEPRLKRRRRVDQEGNIAADSEENGNPESSAWGAEASEDVQLVSLGKSELGDKVTVSWGGFDYNCRVVAVRATSVKVHYLGWSTGYDQWVPLPEKKSVPTVQQSEVTSTGENSSTDVQVKLKKNMHAPKQGSRRLDEGVDDIAKLLSRSSLNLEPLLPPTKGDGNCWFRSISAQAVGAGLPPRFSDHRQLRLEVSAHMKQLPQDISTNIVDTVFKGKVRGLRNLAFRQAVDGQWIDDNGVVALATSHLLQRNVAVYSFPPPNSGETAAKTMVEGGATADTQPLTVFYHGNHYQALQRKVVGKY